MPRLAAIAVSLLTLAAPLLAASGRLRVHPNPSIVILSIAQGPDGFLWLAAEDGLYRFDGLRYQKLPDFPFASARFVAVTSDGSLWAAGRQGLARYKSGFAVVLREPVYAMAGLPDQVFVAIEPTQNQAGRRNMEAPDGGLASVHPDGSVTYLGERPRKDLTADSAGRVWFVSPPPFRARAIAPGHPAEETALPDPYEQVVRDSAGRLWAADHERVVALEGGKETQFFERRPSNRTARRGPLAAGRNGHLWFLGETVRNLTTGLEFRDRHSSERFQPTAGYEDTRGHFWVARLGQGLVEWIPEPEWQRWFPEDLGQQAAVQVVRTPQGTHVAATRGNLYRLDAGTGRWTALGGESRRYAALHALPDGGFLASIRKLGLVRLSGAGRIVDKPPNPLPSADEYREIIRDGAGRLWVGNKLALLRIEGYPGKLRLAREPLPRSTDEAGLTDQAVELELDGAGRLWAGYDEGVAWLDPENRWHRLLIEPHLTAIRSLALHDPLAGEDIWVAYRRGGEFSRLRRSQDRWIASSFSAGAGYSPLDTHFLKRDSRGWIWRGSPEGVHVCDGRHTAPEDWIHIQIHSGLGTDATDQYGFFEDSDGSVWISGEEGVSHIRPDSTWFDAPRNASPPRISRIEADDRVYLAAMPDAIPAETERLRIDVGSLDTPKFRDYPFRYRLEPLFHDWKPSRDGRIEFSRLPQNSYRLEVVYNGNGPSPVLSFPFQVGLAGRSLSWLWWIGFPLAGCAATLIVRRTAWYPGTNYWVRKAVFLLRRRRSYQEAAPPACGGRESEILAGRYRLLRPISQGGFSVVYEALDLKEPNTRVAVKILDVSLKNETWVRDRFAYEVASLRSVDHPGVSPIMDSWVSPGGEPCLVMPYLAGPTLREEMAAGPLPPERAARIVQKLGSALAEVHKRGIVHRDLKPENVILLDPASKTESPVLIDFGMASLRGGAKSLWNTTLLGGSLNYMSPERLTGHYSQASDIYSFGVIILEMLSGKRLGDLGAMVSQESFPRALEQALEPCIAREKLPILARYLHQCYAAEPQRRPPDAAEFAATIAELLAAR